MNYFLNATDFLLQSVIGIILFIVLLRFWMQWVRADFRNELGQFIITVTNPVVIPLRKIIPSLGAVDSATILLAYALSCIKVFALFSVRGVTPEFFSLAVYAFGFLLQSSIYLLFAAIIIQIVASWINPHSYHPIINLARSISEPIMAPARKLIPPMGGLDFSPIFVILFLQFSLRLFVAPLLPY